MQSLLGQPRAEGACVFLIPKVKAGAKEETPGRQKV